YAVQAGIDETGGYDLDQVLVGDREPAGERLGRGEGRDGVMIFFVAIQGEPTLESTRVNEDRVLRRGEAEGFGKDVRPSMGLRIRRGDEEVVGGSKDL